MRYFVLLMLAGAMLMTLSCRDDEAMHSAERKLQFSVDTVLFDTVFTSMGSFTKQFKVYNPHNSAIQIERIDLGYGEQSEFRINVDGDGGTAFRDKRIGAEDSIFIFVDVKIDPTDEGLPFIVRDSVRFVTDETRQHVKLMAWGQNARYHRNEVLCDGMSQITWDNEKPYVIIDSVLVPSGCRLTIEAGTRIYSHHRSAFLVAGTMEANGTVDEPVYFGGHRLDEFYKDQPGQWLGIRFLPGSSDNVIHNAVIENGIRGIQVDSLPVTNNPNLRLWNAKVRNMSQIGMLGNTAHIQAINCLFHGADDHLFAGIFGGRYELLFSTFAHRGGNFSSDEPAILLSNDDFESSSTISNDLEIQMVNSIVWGNREEEILISTPGDGDVQLNIFSNLLKTELGESIDGLSDDNILNEDPLFVDPADYNFRLEEGSPAIGAGESIQGIDTDIKGNARKDNPDLGAFETNP